MPVGVVRASRLQSSPSTILARPSDIGHRRRKLFVRGGCRSARSTSTMMICLAGEVEVTAAVVGRIGGGWTGVVQYWGRVD